MENILNIILNVNLGAVTSKLGKPSCFSTLVFFLYKINTQPLSFMTMLKSLTMLHEFIECPDKNQQKTTITDGMAALQIC